MQKGSEDLKQESEELLDLKDQEGLEDLLDFQEPNKEVSENCLHNQ